MAGIRFKCQSFADIPSAPASWPISIINSLISLPFIVETRPAQAADDFAHHCFVAIGCVVIVAPVVIFFWLLAFVVPQVITQRLFQAFAERVVVILFRQHFSCRTSRASLQLFSPVMGIDSTLPGAKKVEHVRDATECPGSHVAGYGQVTRPCDNVVVVARCSRLLHAQVAIQPIVTDDFQTVKCGINQKS
ncbi:Uncharacterised protein [Klebsiella pneumoniae]|nr:Uncharacterised protein [Klebsiella pneumoniae]